MISSLSGNE